MRKGLYVIGLGLFVVILSAALQAPKKPEFVPGQILVKFRPDISAQAMESAMLEVKAQRVAAFSEIRVQQLILGEDIKVEEAVKKLAALPNVEYAEPNYIYHTMGRPDDPNFSQLWGMDNTGQTGGTVGADIKALSAWDITTGNGTVLVGVIDTGVDFTHEDLAMNIYNNPGEDAWSNPNDPSTGNKVDDDGNGKVDDWKGWNFIANNNNSYDDNMHGSHCAGTIGAIGNNGKGVAGVNWTVKIMPLKFLDSGGSGDTSDAVDAIIYAANMGVKILSNSWGGGGYSQALKDAIDYANSKGVLFVAAAGNDGTNNDVSPNYPSNYDSPNVLAVAASDDKDQRALWGSGGGEDDEPCGFVCSNAMAATPGSNYGKNTVDLAAPGKGILSTVPGNSYRSLSGTSMATPHVAGAAALLLAKSSGLTPLDLKNYLMNSVDKLPAFKDITVSGGRLNVYTALQSF